MALRPRVLQRRHNPRIFKTPSTPAQAQSALDSWLSQPTIRLLSEEHGYWPLLTDLITASQPHGAMIHDTRIAALCLHHAVSALWSADRDFSRYPQLRTLNPLIASTA
jgi:uncharacterized protein